jgi:protein required for attachment to host cells
VEFSDGDPARPEKSFASDRPGRAFDSFGSGRHAMASSETGRHHEARKFARQVADYLNAGIAANSFNNIVLISSPAFLGLVRPELSEAARRAVVHELARDLTDLDADAIRHYFT